MMGLNKQSRKSFKDFENGFKMFVKMEVQTIQGFDHKDYHRLNNAQIKYLLLDITLNSPFQISWFQKLWVQVFSKEGIDLREDEEEELKGEEAKYPQSEYLHIRKLSMKGKNKRELVGLLMKYK